jgi:hypothetical protein
MEYEYKSVVLVKSGYVIEENNSKTLQSFFDQGWEYVNCITQAGGSHPAIIVILRKIKVVML